MTDKIRNYTIIASFVLGWIITITGFFVPPLGVINNSVIIIFGQAMTYCAVGVGMKDYVDSKLLGNNKNDNN